jgi:hypothetical protein
MACCGCHAHQSLEKALSKHEIIGVRALAQRNKAGSTVGSSRGSSLAGSLGGSSGRSSPGMQRGGSGRGGSPSACTGGGRVVAGAAWV